MKNDDWRRERLTAASAKVGGDAALGRLMGYKSGAQVGHMRYGRRPVTEKTIERLESLPGFDNWFGKVRPELIAQKLEMATPIPHLEEAISCGQEKRSMFIGSMFLARAWIEQHAGADAKQHLRFFYCFDDSMAPTFADGDILLVDTSQRDPEAIDGVYILRAQGHLRLYVQRIRRSLNGSLEASSDNPSIKTVDVLDGSRPLDVLGRIIWAWNGRKV